MNETKQLTGFIAEIAYSDLSYEVIGKAKGLILDQFGCQLAFAAMPWSKAELRSEWVVKTTAGDEIESGLRLRHN